MKQRLNVLWLLFVSLVFVAILILVEMFFRQANLKSIADVALVTEALSLEQAGKADQLSDKQARNNLSKRREEAGKLLQFKIVSFVSHPTKGSSFFDIQVKRSRFTGIEKIQCRHNQLGVLLPDPGVVEKR